MIEEKTIGEILQFLKGQNIIADLHGDEKAQVAGYSSLGRYRTGSMTWAKTQKNWDACSMVRPRLLIAQTGLCADAENIIYTEESKRAFFSLIEWMQPEQQSMPAIGSGTILSPEVKLGKNVTIGCNCVLQGNITVGDGTQIAHQVVIMGNVQIGSDCQLQSGCVIGSDGFAYTEKADGTKKMVRHYGGVEIGNHVFIGVNTQISRGQIDNTLIGDGCKIDALCHVAHNVELEENCAVVAESVLMGSVKAEQNCFISTALIRNQCQLGKGAYVGMGSVVVKNVEENEVVIGVPAKPIKRRKQTV